MMKTFRVWLEEKDDGDIQATILDRLGLDKNTGLGTSLGHFDHDSNGEPFVLRQLQDLGFWKSLPPEKTAEARNMIMSGDKTVGELIQSLNSSVDPTEKVGVSPPEGEEPKKEKPPEPQSQPSQAPVPPQGGQQQLPAPM